MSKHARRAAAACAVLATLVLPAAAGAQLHTAVIDYPATAFEGSQASAGFSRVHGAGARYVKVFLNWRAVAPTRPAQATNPADPAYRWQLFDAKLTEVRRQGLEPLVWVGYAPAWASTSADGWANVDFDELAPFARAAAERYDGTFDPDPNNADYAEALPRVRLWQAWNEPNLAAFLSPQYQNGSLVSADAYRRLVNAFAASVKAANPGNRVLAGGTGPFRRVTNSAPLTFMRAFLCLRKNLTPIANCGPVRFDIWGHHPYTSGAPTRRAIQREDVSLGNLPEMQRVLRTAERRGKIASSGRVQFWVDEFSWDSSPPDPGAIPAAAPRTLDGGGALPHVAGGHHARRLAPAQRQPLHGPLRRPLPVRALLLLPEHRELRDRSSRSPPSSSRSWPFVTGGACSSGAERPARSAARQSSSARSAGRGGASRPCGRTPSGSSPRGCARRRAGSFARRLGGSKSLGFSLTPARDRFYNPFGQRPGPGQCG